MSSIDTNQQQYVILAYALPMFLFMALTSADHQQPWMLERIHSEIVAMYWYWADTALKFATHHATSYNLVETNTNQSIENCRQQQRLRRCDLLQNKLVCFLSSHREHML